MSRVDRKAFTLIEVLIGMALFFMAIFAILSLTTRSLGAARSLQRAVPNPGILAAELSSITNRVEEGAESGDFGKAFPDYTWRRDVYAVATNGLFRADFWVERRGDRTQNEPSLSILLYRPESVAGGR